MSVKVGQVVRLRVCRGHITQAEAGRLVTVRALGRSLDPQFAVRVDDGDPADENLLTNGHQHSWWLPLSAVDTVKP